MDTEKAPAVGFTGPVGAVVGVVSGGVVTEGSVVAGLVCLVDSVALVVAAVEAAVEGAVVGAVVAPVDGTVVASVEGAAVGCVVGAVVAAVVVSGAGAVVGASVAVVSAPTITAGRSPAIRQMARKRPKNFLFIINTPLGK